MTQSDLINRFGDKPIPITPSLAVSVPKMIPPEKVEAPLLIAQDSAIPIPKKYVIVARIASSAVAGTQVVDLNRYANFEYITIWCSSGTLADVFALNDVAGKPLAYVNGANNKATVPMLREQVSISTPATANLTCLVIAHSRQELA